ncbi:alpha/beta hydrolase [Dactylosporangium aurantiacum]|uniref:Alpha/beta hydrolase n=1 Tax=Dactylosporangium aurantiacum TaxID=35754 RepID=A0A9Q9IBA5_9ACTN|nr:alpha/beta hydrolase [Dactylosporangium aurantiacum]MDG6107321.1 alpha/beta hydrolase [Dactylosporangium aurantiacum]UWZ51153.1 alpha/beta hydrolase [Dactylosporangium aurantiacum]
MATLRRPVQLTTVAGAPVEFRFERRGPDVLLVLHGGHMRAGLALGEDAFAGAGYSILAPSRPGYGRTPLRSGPTPAAYTDTVKALCGQLGIARVAAVVGISGGGPTAVTMAARHPDLVERLVLISAVGPLPWPDRRTRLGARLVFRPGVEAVTWAAVRWLLRLGGRRTVRRLLRQVSTARGTAALAGVRAADEAMLLELFGAMRSGRGFVHDLRPAPDVTASVRQPALVIASRDDGGVPFAHARALTAGLPHAALVESGAAGHFVWCAPDWPRVAARIVTFLRAPVQRPAG